MKDRQIIKLVGSTCLINLKTGEITSLRKYYMVRFFCDKVRRFIRLK